jgi:hypothetical protein
MPFSEKLKLDVKRKAAFQCCRCRAIGVDIHHIIPEKEGGSSDFSNAAPLCQNCHDQFGDNAQKRKEIIRMRDWWFVVCEKTYNQPGPLSLDLLSDINKKLENIQAGQEDIRELKKMLESLTNWNIDSINPDSATIVASGIINTISANQMTGSYTAHKFCKQCKKIFDSVDVLSCPDCGGEFDIRFEFFV